MSFCEHLNLLLDKVGAMNSEIAEYMGIDRTYLAHFKKGRRIPKKNGKTALRICDGIIRYCKDKGRLDVLKSLTGSDDPGMGMFLLEWLYEEDSVNEEAGTPENDIRSSNTASKTAFGSRLDIAMQFAGISNIQLSRRINVDASLISRYRSGERMPRSDSEIISRIGKTLWHDIRKNRAEAQFAAYTGSDDANIDENGFIEWLFNINGYKAGQSNHAFRLLEMFDSYKMPDMSHKITKDNLSRLVFSSKKAYHGFAGFREAVIKFLVSVINSNAESMLLYSDQDMRWMFSEQTFISQWGALMAEAVRNGTHITVIHNIDRGIEEMTEAIGIWLPLYMSGMIQPYICKKPKDSRFSHSLFISPGICSVEASHVIGTEEQGIYYYRDDKNHLQLDGLAFEKLMEHAEPLIKIYPAKPLPVIEGFGRTSDEAGQTSDIGNAEYDGSEFENIRFSIEKDSVIIRHLDNPPLNFEFTEPSLVNTFKSYVLGI